MHASQITDFGISVKSDKSTQLKEAEIEGTLFYLAPEVLAEKIFSKESDVYAYGLCAYEVIKRVDAATEQGVRELPRLQFAQMRLAEPFPIKPETLTPLLPSIRTFIEHCCSLDRNLRPHFDNMSKPLQLLRKELLHLNLDEQIEEAQRGKDLTLEEVVRDWNGRMQGFDWAAIQQFKADFNASKRCLPYLIEQLLTTPDMADALIMEIDSFLGRFYGGAFRELAINLRAFHRAYQKCRSEKINLLAFVQSEVLVALRTTSDPTLHPAAASEQELKEWLRFIGAAEVDSTLADELGINRYLQQKCALEERIAALQKALELNMKQLQKLKELPLATECITSYVCTSSVANESLIASAERDVTALKVASAEFSGWPSLRSSLTQHQKDAVHRFKKDVRTVEERLRGMRVLMNSDVVDLQRIDRLLGSVRAVMFGLPSSSSKNLREGQ